MEQEEDEESKLSFLSLFFIYINLCVLIVPPSLSPSFTRLALRKRTSSGHNRVNLIARSVAAGRPLLDASAIKPIGTRGRRRRRGTCFIFQEKGTRAELVVGSPVHYIDIRARREPIDKAAAAAAGEVGPHRRSLL